MRVGYRAAIPCLAAPLLLKAWGPSPRVAATALGSAFTPSLLLPVLRSIATNSNIYERCMAIVCQQSVLAPEFFIAFMMHCSLLKAPL